jgi:riboflavin synthase
VFTGIVQERGRVASFEDGRLVVESGISADIGDSVAVDGVCLTVVDAQDGRLEFDVVPETLSRVKGFEHAANLEPALRVGDPLGGHYVQGHVDGVGTVRAVEDRGEQRTLWIKPPGELQRYIVEKGSIAVDGVSLTVASLAAGGTFSVALVPHTLDVTTFSDVWSGKPVNLEVDVLAKYVERLLRSSQ